MAPISTLIVSRLDVPVSTGQEAIWQIIRALDKKGPWSIADIDGETSSAHFDTLVEFVRRLRAGGYVDLVGTRPVKGGTPMNLYRVVINQSEAPRLRRDGSKAPPSGQQQMWRAMRNLRHGFSYRDLVRVASTDELTITEISAKTYLHRLADAGLLQMLQPCKKGRHNGSPAVWRLKPSANTGPLAPQVLRTHFVFDPNRRVVVGEPSLAENTEEVR
ncbi:MAG: hypothetical protein QM576_04320 [Rhodopseudomonas sp.]|uniref:hypothetical protein n=1 Tax=Rhodopseudomonas sp. TaxID=1078 RepID=UPI0039E65727